jgi:hypothetical protein
MQQFLHELFTKFAAGQSRQEVEQRTPDHVVVFVHGMGRALKGGTLQEWAQPLAQSLCDLSLDAFPNSKYPSLVISKANAVGEAPEMLVKVLRGHDRKGDPNYLHVLMTEASWSTDFAPATALDTYWWAASMAKTVFRRSVYLLRWNMYPGREKGWRVLIWLFKWLLLTVVTVISIVLGLLLLFVTVILLLVVVLVAKFPGLGQWVSGFVALFADFLGDPQVWKKKPLQAAAMRQRIRDTLQRWDHDRGIPVTVVAHSQGAAVAGQVLFQGSQKARATNFVTVGSGLGLLGYARWGGPTSDPVADWLRTPEIRWINVWGKFDFVPAGPISTDRNGPRPVFKKIYDRNSKGSGGPGPEEHPVYNRSALIYDHIVYSKNRVEVIDPIAGLIFPEQGGPAGESSDRLWFSGAQGDRRTRPHRVMVKSLGATRALAISAGALLAPVLLSLLASIPSARRLFQCNTDQPEQGPWWSLWLCNGSSYQWASPGDWVILAVTGAVIAGILIAFLNGPLWTLLHCRVESRRKKPRKRQHRKPGDLPRELPGEPAGNPWLNVILYLASSVLLTVALPMLALSAQPRSWLIYAGSAAVLFAFCFTGTGISPLPARTSGSSSRNSAASPRT